MYKFIVKGVVQGVGFRPYIYNSCVREGIFGYVQNVGDGVIIVADDKEKIERILKGAPRLSRINEVCVEHVDEPRTKFHIRPSSGFGYSEIPPDLYLCEDCLYDLKDESNRRYGYFFVTCTNCGPRFSITKKSPYDRCNTTMDVFKMCESCRKEYEDPSNRRYHAQTIACKECGPKVYLIKDGKITYDNPIKKAADEIKKGNLVAIKGVGGFHIACRTDSIALEKLRIASNRPNKPYAIMCKDIDMARKYAYISDDEERIMASFKRPIVVVKKKMELMHVSELSSLGIMLPYTALHYLLFDYIDEAIVMTSSNVSDEPITTKDNEQFVSIVLSHDRNIENPIDDSVIKIAHSKKLFLRRSRGFVPESILMKKGFPDMVALGAELNNTFCVYKDGQAFLSQYMGTTSNLKTLDNYKKIVRKFLEYTNAKPKIILCDMHPQYETTAYAEELSLELGAKLIKVQHHRAHAYSAAAENNIGDFAAIVCDGLGFGDDSSIWGGEVFVNSKRVGHLEEQIMLGGDSATRFPAKMLLSILLKFMTIEEAKSYLKGHFDDKELKTLKRQHEENYNCPKTTSCGRIFDAASFLLGFCDEMTYEGRPAMLLDENSTEPYEFEPVIEKNILMTTPLFKFLCDNIDLDKRRLAATVQKYVAEGLFKIASQYKRPVLFSGGCAYSRIMSKHMSENKVYFNRKVPSGDGGISFGQIAYYMKNF